MTDPDLAEAERIAEIYQDAARELSDEERDAVAEAWYEQHYQPGISDPAATSRPGGTP